MDKIPNSVILDKVDRVKTYLEARGAKLILETPDVYDYILLYQGILMNIEINRKTGEYKAI